MTPLQFPVLPQRQAKRLGPVVTQALEHFRSPTMTPGVPYALFPCLGPLTRPWGYASLSALARRIHRDRGPDALQLRPVRVRFRDADRELTEVLAEDQQAGRVRRIGFAWIAGRDWRALQAALDAAVPVAAVEG